MSKKVNLDTVKSTSAPAETITGTGGALVISGRKETEGKANSPLPSKGLADIYDQRKKLMWLFDISGSMGSAVGSTKIEDFVWPDDAKLEADVEPIISNAEVQVANNCAFGDEVIWAECRGLQGDMLKQKIVDNGLARGLEHLFPIRGDVNVSKLDLVKRILRRLIQLRVEKNPDADIEAIAFDDDYQVLDCKTPETLIAAIDKQYPRGGTNIAKAVLEGGLKVISKRPSEVGMHHIVLVSDAQDSSVFQLVDNIPTLKEFGVVFDAIYVKELVSKAYRTIYGDQDDASLALKKVCDATGGEYIEVTNAADFELKFVAASTRKLLPSAG